MAQKLDISVQKICLLSVECMCLCEQVSALAKEQSKSHGVQK